MTGRPSLLDLARGAGLLSHRPKRKGGWLVGNCPTGCDGADPKRAATHYHPDGNAWSCKRCGEGGGPPAWRDAYGADVTPRTFTPPTRAPRGARLDVPGAWAAVTDRPGLYVDALCAWATDARGWSPELAAAVVELGKRGELALVTPDLAAGARGPGRTLARRTEPGRGWDARPLLLPLYDGEGAIRSVERRWHLAGAPPDGESKSRALSNGDTGDPELWGKVRAFGRIDRWAERAARGEAVYLVEGGPDWAAAAAWCLVRGEGAAIGSPSAGGLRTVAAAAADALRRLDADPAAVRVVVVPHLGDPRDVGELGMLAAADVLRGLGTVALARVCPDGCKGDLADVAAGAAESVEALSRVLDGATVLYRPPVDVSTPAGRDAVREVVAECIDAAAPDRVTGAAVTPGAGKSHAAAQLAADAARDGRAVYLAAANHRLAAELVGMVEAHGVPVEHARGALQHCEHLRRFELSGQTDAALGLRRAYAAGGRRGLCGTGAGRCDRADTCPGSKRPRLIRGVVVVGTHAGAASVELPAPICPCGFKRPKGDPSTACKTCNRSYPRPLVVVDELPGTVEAVDVDAGALATLHTGATLAAAWRDEHPEWGELARRLAHLGDLQGAAYAASRDDKGQAPRHPAYIGGEALAAVLADAGAEALDLLARAERLAAADALSPPRPWPEDARRGAARHWPDAGAWGLCLAVAQLAAYAGATVLEEGPSPVPAPAEAPCVHLRLDPDGTAAWTLRTRFELPEGVDVVGLDGTAAPSRPEWEALAAANGRRVELHHADAVSGPPAAAVHYRTGALRTGELWGRRAGRIWWRPRAEGATRNALAAVLDAARGAGKVRGTLGIVTHKPLADALRLGTDDPPEATPWADDDPVPAQLAALAEWLRGEGWGLVVGHFGADDRGSNRFEAVDVLAVLGDPRPDAGACAADAEALGFDAGGRALYDARTRAAGAQAVARARHLRRADDPPVLVYVGHGDPPVGAELPAVAWAEVVAAQGAHAPTLAALEDRGVVWAHAEAEGAVGVGPLLSLSGLVAVGRKGLARAVQDEARRRGWPAWDAVPGDGRRAWKVYAPTLEAATAYARRKCLESKAVFRLPGVSSAPVEAPTLGACAGGGSTDRMTEHIEGFRGDRRSGVPVDAVDLALERAGKVAEALALDLGTVLAVLIGVRGAARWAERVEAHAWEAPTWAAAERSGLADVLPNAPPVGELREAHAR